MSRFRSATRIVVSPKARRSIFSIRQTQDRLLKDDTFSRDSIWSELLALK